MMMEHYLRPSYQQVLVNPVANRLRGRVTPNQITVLSGVFGVLVLPALVFNQVFLAIGLLLLSGYCDTLDGTLARAGQEISHWGSALDIMIDRLVELGVVLALWAVAPEVRGLWCLLMLGSMLLCITSFLVVGIFTANDSSKSFHYSPGLMERAEAFLFFIAMMLWPSMFVWLALLFTLLVLATAVSRLLEFRHQTVSA
jgi:phosphatidylglycerophosphate synthase